MDTAQAVLPCARRSLVSDRRPLHKAKWLTDQDVADTVAAVERKNTEDLRHNNSETSARYSYESTDATLDIYSFIP